MCYDTGRTLLRFRSYSYGKKSPFPSALLTVSDHRFAKSFESTPRRTQSYETSSARKSRLKKKKQKTKRIAANRFTSPDPFIRRELALRDDCFFFAFLVLKILNSTFYTGFFFLFYPSISRFLHIVYINLLIKYATDQHTGSSRIFPINRSVI